MAFRAAVITFPGSNCDRDMADALIKYETIDEEQIKALPLNGRNFVSLTRTVPGVMRGIPGSNIDGALVTAARKAPSSTSSSDAR